MNRCDSDAKTGANFWLGSQSALEKFTATGRSALSTRSSQFASVAVFRFTNSPESSILLSFRMEPVQECARCQAERGIPPERTGLYVRRASEATTPQMAIHGQAPSWPAGA